MRQWSRDGAQDLVDLFSFFFLMGKMLNHGTLGYLCGKLWLSLTDGTDRNWCPIIDLSVKNIAKLCKKQ